MALAVIATLSILGLETTRTKEAALVLRATTERICKNVARSAMLPHEALAAFKGEINSLQALAPFTKITEAKLILPLMVEPNTTGGGITDIFYDFVNASSSTCSPLISTFDPLPNSPRSVPFSSIAPTYTCQNSGAAPTMTDCTLVHDICERTSSPPSPDPSYPPSMWSDLYNAGNTVGCELTATVDKVIPFAGSSATRIVTAKAAWWIPVRARAPFLADPSLPAAVSSHSGLSLGIATQLTTWAGDMGSLGMSGPDERFHFTAYGSILSSLDPRGALIAPPQRLNFSGGLSNGSTPIDYPLSYGVSGLQIPPSPPLLNSGNASRASEEFLTACFNPLVLIRNVITSTIVELAARHGQLRNLTQIASINPRHNGAAAGWATAPNRPVEMVRFGEDLTNEKYQSPFVTYYAEGTIPDFGAQDGFVLPWKQNLNPIYSHDPDKLNRNTIIAQQLRYCYHLWDTDLITRPLLPVHSSFSLFPLAFSYKGSLQNNGGNTDYILYPTWDYGRPWGQPNAVSQVSRLLTAAELVQSLGSTQRCPAPDSDMDYFKSCRPLGSSFDPRNDLEPDLLGYLQYQLGSLEPYPSPGLFHPINTSNSFATAENQIAPQKPMHIPTSNIQGARSVVVIVTSKGLFDAPLSPYHAALTSAVATLNSSGRPVVIVFIPATGADSNTVPNFCTALRRGTDCSVPEMNADNNRFFVLSPYAQQYEATYIASSEGQTFINYWSDLLTAGQTAGDLYAPRVGRDIFIEGIVGLGPKL